MDNLLAVELMIAHVSAVGLEPGGGDDEGIKDQIRRAINTAKLIRQVIDEEGDK